MLFVLEVIFVVLQIFRSVLHLFFTKKKQDNMLNINTATCIVFCILGLFFSLFLEHFYYDH
jgi:multisubunit Na+/H+ antiporter MnhF subunit